MQRGELIQTSKNIAIITVLLLIVIQIFQFINGGASFARETHPNEEFFASAGASQLGNIGVALSTRIGIQFKEATNSFGTSSESFYREITTVGTSAQENRAIRSDLISQNMLIIKEYLNLSMTDIKGLLDSSNDREATLEAFITQLENRFKSSSLSAGSLERQKNLLLTHIESIEAEIETVKSSMEENFSAGDTEKTLNNVDEYFALRAEYTEAFTDIVFINQFLKQHNFLNEYNKGILDTLINNKDAIIKESFIVIPDSGDEYLRPLDLLFDEEEFKAR